MTISFLYTISYRCYRCSVGNDTSSNGFWDIKAHPYRDPHPYRDHDLDLPRSCDIIGHMTIRPALCGFLCAVCWTFLISSMVSGITMGSKRRHCLWVPASRDLKLKNIVVLNFYRAMLHTVRLWVGTVENHGKNGQKHGTLLWKSQKSRQNHSSLYSC